MYSTTRLRSDVWQAGTGVTASRLATLRFNSLLLTNFDSVIDKYQTGVMSTTCNSSTDVLSD